MPAMGIESHVVLNAQTPLPAAGARVLPVAIREGQQFSWLKFVIEIKSNPTVRS